MKRFFLFLFILLAVAGGIFFWWANQHADLSTLPPLRNGDIIMQTSVDNQTLPIIVATASYYTHAGIIRNDNGTYSVIHTGSVVTETPLSEFVKFGIGEHFLILRNETLTDGQRQGIVVAAASHMGTKYDYVFSSGNVELYCSELVHLAYQAQQVAVGKVEKIADLYMNNEVVRDLFAQRWKNHPLCQDPDMTYDACWVAVLDDDIVTPVSIVQDKTLTRIYSNY